MTGSAVALRLPRREALVAVLQSYGVYLALAVLLVYNLLFTPNFFELDNFRTQFVQVVPVLIVALGMALVIGAEGVDLSVGAVMAVVAAIIPLYIGYGFVPAALLGIAAGLVIGLLNGSMVAFIGVQPIVATLALMVAGRGVALLIAGEQLRSITDPGLLALGRGGLFEGTPFRIPYAVLIAAVLVALVAVLVGRTTFGRQLLAVGGNRRAAQLAGLPVRRVLLVTYVLCAGLAGIAGVIASARLGASVPSTIGNLIELSAITAVVVGGTPLSGGRIRIAGTVAGALLLQFITATLVKQNVPDAYSQMIQAAIILVAVYLQRGRIFGR